MKTPARSTNCPESRALARESKVDAEATRALDVLARNGPYARPTVTRQAFQKMLLHSDGWMMLSGKQYDVKGEHLGAGVYRCRLEERK